VCGAAAPRPSGVRPAHRIGRTDQRDVRPVPGQARRRERRGGRLAGAPEHGESVLERRPLFPEPAKHQVLSLTSPTRRCAVDLSRPAARVVRALDRPLEWRGEPKVIRSDNGPEYISEAGATVGDWPGYSARVHSAWKPQQNADVERYNRTVRYDWFAQTLFDSIEERRRQRPPSLDVQHRTTATPWEAQTYSHSICIGTSESAVGIPHRPKHSPPT
jgi:hypothetical protein